MRSRRDNADGLTGRPRKRLLEAVSERPFWNRVLPADFPARLSAFGGLLAFVGHPVSVSLSQFGLFLAVIGWAWRRSSLRRPAIAAASQDAPALAFRGHPALYAGLALYAVQLLSLLVNSAEAGLSVDSGAWAATGAFFARGAGTEFKDLLLLPAAFWVYSYAGDRAGRERLERWLWIAIAILLASGLIAVFSRWRLSKLPYHLEYGFTAGPEARFQHHLLTFWFGDSPLHLYMPIGLLNTHLTYGGILMLAFPALVLRALDPFVRNPRSVVSWNWLGRATLAGGAGLIFLLNNSRSAMLGALIALLIGMWFFFRMHWGRRVLRLLPFLAFGALALFALDRASADLHYRFERIVASLLGQSKHTDSQRTLLWGGVYRVALEEPLLGTGPGAFTEAIEDDILEFGRENPRLWASYAFAQRGHAHSDLFHFQAIAGPLAVLAYLAIFFFYLRAVFRPGVREAWRWGPAGMLFAGLLQCYFQDDEVLLPFWLYLGLALAAADEASGPPGDDSRESGNQERNIQPDGSA